MNETTRRDDERGSEIEDVFDLVEKRPVPSPPPDVKRVVLRAAKARMAAGDYFGGTRRLNLRSRTWRRIAAPLAGVAAALVAIMLLQPRDGATQDEVDVAWVGQAAPAEEPGPIRDRLDEVDLRLAALQEEVALTRPSRPHAARLGDTAGSRLLAKARRLRDTLIEEGAVSAPNP